MHFRSILLLWIIVGASLFVYSQNETSKWYFGGNAGLDFMTSPPTLLVNGAMGCIDCASIANAQGALQFYTDGLKVWNANHVLMANGTLTTGTSSGPVIIVKQPGNSNIYYIFSKPNFAGWPFMYSVVDMNLAAGMGSVTVKGVILSQSSARKVAAIQKCNSSDVWIISHDYNSALFRSFLLTPTGISPGGTISGSMSYIGSNQADQEGDLKISPNGKKLAIGTAWGNTFDIYDFDLTNGVVTNPTTPLIIGPYGNTYRGESCEFSPDGSKFYGKFSAPNTEPIFQYDLCAGSDSAILASQYLIVNTPNLNIQFGQLQLAQDGKIYIARNGNPTAQTNLSVINDPNQSGIGCNYSNTGISIAPKVSSIGLPKFTASYLRHKPKISTSTFCGTVFFLASGVNTQGCAFATEPVSSMEWDFGDPLSSQNSSTLSNPSHFYSSTGSYTVKLMVNYSCSSDTISKQINISATSPVLTITGPTTICSGESMTLTASGATSYTWNTGIVSSSLVVSPSTSISFLVNGSDSANTCIASQQVNIQVKYCVGLHENHDLQEIPKFYPNPTTGILDLSVAESLSVSIFNIYGERLGIYECSAIASSIDISSFTCGVYYLRYDFCGKSQCIKVIKTQ